MDVDAGQFSLSRLAKEKGHRVRVMGVSSAVEHIFNEPAMHAKAHEGKQRMSWSKSEGQGKRKNRENSKKNTKEPQVPKARRREKHRKLVSHILKIRNQRHAQTLRNLHRHVPLTLLGSMVGMERWLEW